MAFFSFLNRSSLPPRGKKKDFFAIVICHHVTPSCLKIPIQPLFFFALAAQLSKLLQNKAKNPSGAHKSHCNNSLPSDTGETGSPNSGKASGKWLNFYLSKSIAFVFERLEAWQISLVSYLLSLNMCPCRCWQMFTPQWVKSTTYLCLKIEEAPVSTKLYEVSIHKVWWTASKGE